MLRYRPSLELLRDEDRKRMSSTNLGTAYHSEIGFDSSADDLTIRIISIHDWFIAYVKGQGSLHMRSIPEAQQQPRDYLVLAMEWYGQAKSTSYPFRPGNSGQMNLHAWDEGYDVMNSGNYEFIVAHLPRRALGLNDNDLNDAMLGAGYSVHQGMGSVLAASIRALVFEGMHMSVPMQLKSLLPGISDMARSVFVSAFHEPVVHLEESRLRKIEAFVRDHFSDADLSADKVAAACGMSRRQCFRVFSHHHESFAELMRRIRLEQAAKILRRFPWLSITSIAYDCGFGSTSVFARSFHDHYGMSPRQFRRGSQNREVGKRGDISRIAARDDITIEGA